MPKDYCTGCIYNGKEQCEVPPGYPHCKETQRLCRDAGWRVRRGVRGPAVRRSASTGEWAEYLEKAR